LHDLVAGAPQAPRIGGRFGAPKDTIANVGQCRIVVTGTFHTAVFALSQGIPAGGPAQSPMYREKFGSLADQFGPGCQALTLDDPDLENKLTNAIDAAWQAAERLRPELLSAAERQIAMGRAAYRRIYELVTARQESRT